MMCVVWLLFVSIGIVVADSWCLTDEVLDKPYVRWLTAFVGCIVGSVVAMIIGQTFGLV